MINNSEHDDMFNIQNQNGFCFMHGAFVARIANVFFAIYNGLYTTHIYFVYFDNIKRSGCEKSRTKKNTNNIITEKRIL